MRFVGKFSIINEIIHTYIGMHRTNFLGIFRISWRCGTGNPQREWVALRDTTPMGGPSPKERPYADSPARLCPGGCFRRGFP